MPDIDVVRHARARRLKLSVDPASGRVRLTLPPRASLARAMAWVEAHGDWIAAQRDRLPDARPFAPGAIVPVEGVDLTIDWSAERARTIRRDDDRLVCGGPLDGLSRRVETWLKRRALAVLSEETAEFAAKAGVAVGRVSIGDPRGRWGSCASSGAIRYSWRLICAPSDVRRATVAHEVAHRLHMDHSPAFHAAHRALYGADPASARAWLRRHGTALHWLGRRS